MTSRVVRATSTERLRASPSFAQAFSLDGRPYVAKETEPYVQYWLTERYRVLLSMFGGRRGATEHEAVEGYLRLTRAPRTVTERTRLTKAVADMRAAGVLIGVRDDVSRYTARMVDDYVTHRAFPSALAEHIVARAGLTATRRALDLAGGPGDLALALAKTSGDVTLMELSRAFVQAARRRAKAQGVSLRAVQESCNRLVFHDDTYDLVTVSQALHWLDDVLVCRGVCRVLRPGGSFVVVHSAMDLDEGHPLAFVLGHQSVLGAKVKQSFADEVRPLLRRLTLLFEALDAPDVQRVDLAAQGGGARVVPTGVSLFTQRRAFDLGYARAFLTPQHIEAAGLTPAAFWREIESRCAAASPEALVGSQHWAVLQFQRGGARMEDAAFDAVMRPLDDAAG